MGEVASRRLDAGALERAEKDAEACRLRAQGWSFAEIRAELGYASQNVVKDAVHRALVETLQAPADELRAVELLLIDQVIRECWDARVQLQPLLDRSGRPVTLLDEDGTACAVEDQQILVQLMQTVLKASEQRRKLMGLDAPQRSVTASAKITLQELQEMAVANGVPAAEVYGTVTELPPGDA